MNKLTQALIVTSLLSFSGCASFTSIHRTFDVSSNDSSLIDIKQRAILVSHDRNDPNAPPIVCAEPSPDAMSSIAYELAASMTDPSGLQKQLANSLQESSAYVGLRSQSIQLLRDFSYRTCEGYLSGALTRDQYDLLMRRYQKSAVALLAIEQLTGSAKQAQSALTTSGSSNLPNTASLQLENVGIRKQINDLKAEKTAKETTKQDTTDIDNKIKDLEKQKLENDKDLQTLSTVTATQGSSQFQGGGSPQPLLIDMAPVAETVKIIVEDIINADDTVQICLAAYATRSGYEDSVRRVNRSEIINPDLKSICTTAFKLYEQQKSAELRAQTAALNYAASLPPTKENVDRVKKLADDIKKKSGGSNFSNFDFKP